MEQQKQVLTGWVKRNVNGTYGFVGVDSGQTYFFHRTDVVTGRLPDVGTAVEFNIIPVKAADRGDRAVNVRVIA